MTRRALSLLVLPLLAACSSTSSTSPADEAPPPPPADHPLVEDPAPAPAAQGLAVREGGALVRAPSGSALYLADEDHGVVRRIPLPIDGQHPPRAISMPGRPAQVLGIGDRVLVTVRDPGLLLVLRDRAGELTEENVLCSPPMAGRRGDGRRFAGARHVRVDAHRVSMIDLGAASHDAARSVGRRASRGASPCARTGRRRT
ncbi:MAG: hypothetical protein U0359_37800 [Byssovorax sp.]